MGAYADNTDVVARLRGRTITATSSPSTTDIDAWVVEGEAFLHGALKAGQITAPITDATGVIVMGGWATDYAEARTRISFATAGGDSGNDDGEKQLEEFRALIKDILDRPTIYQGMLNSGAPGGENVSRVRGYVLSNDDDKSISAGDFDPHIDDGEVW